MPSCGRSPRRRRDLRRGRRGGRVPGSRRGRGPPAGGIGRPVPVVAVWRRTAGSCPGHEVRPCPPPAGVDATDGRIHRWARSAGGDLAGGGELAANRRRGAELSGTGLALQPTAPRSRRSLSSAARSHRACRAPSGLRSPAPPRAPPHHEQGAGAGVVPAAAAGRRHRARRMARSSRPPSTGATPRNTAKAAATARRFRSTAVVARPLPLGDQSAPPAIRQLRRRRGR